MTSDPIELWAPTSAYPSHREADVVLADGSTAHVRPARPDDEQALADFFLGLSRKSRWFRFFSDWTNFDRFVERACDNDYTARLDLLAFAGQPPRIVAHAMYATVGPERAEVAFAVDDAYQHRGLATILLGHLAEAAHDNGITVFEAATLPENVPMLHVFRDSGFPTRFRSQAGEVSVEFPTSLGPQALERFDARDRIAAAAAVRTILEPSSVAVIGASRDPTSVGGAVLSNLLASGYTGRLYAVNPNATDVQGVESYPSVEHIPDAVDLAVVVVPAVSVAGVARGCGAKGVRGLVVISSGFKETGAEGAARERELIEICRATGMRLVGPNCFGVINTDPAVRMNATFGPQMPPAGRVGFLTQSGALGLSVIDHAKKTGLGLSTFVSNGNKGDISGNDLLSYWDVDERTDVILLYLESFGNPRKFARVARHVGRTKPVLAVKSGRSRAGARATSSHTGALIASSDVTVDALFRQSGVIRCDDLRELFHTATLFARQPVPLGERVGIVTNAGGAAILCADACEAEGLDVVELGAGAQAALRAFLPAQASVLNPVDMIASATADDYERAIEAVAASGQVDAIVAIYIPPLVTRAEDIANGLVTAARHLAASERPLPLLGVFMSDDVPGELVGELPVYAFPEEAARPLASAWRYGAWRSGPVGTVHAFDDVHPAEAVGVIAASLARGGGWLPPADVAALLDAYGIARIEQRNAADADEAADAAAAIGAPVALKAIAPDVLHKTDEGAVRLGLPDATAVRREAAALTTRLRDRGHAPDGFVVQRMAEPGVEMLVGMVHDRLFGPVVAVGAGGTTTELVSDVNVRLTPLTDLDVAEMIRSLRTAPLLFGYRGAERGDVEAFEDLVHRVGAMVEAHPEIAELDCNPVVVWAGGATVLDARIRVEAIPPPAPLGAARAPLVA